MFRLWRRMRRADLLAEPFPEEYRAILARAAPLYRILPREGREKLEALVRIFLAEKTFEGAGGLELDDPMCVAIAARACLLVLGRLELDDPLYPGLDAIVVYPDAYRAKASRREGHVVIEDEHARLGESWHRGVVVLSWRAAREGSARPHDGHDVVLHEFAHQLDAESGDVDGAPDLGARERYVAWARVLGEAYEALREAVERGYRTDLDAYGAQSPPEFFAVVTEAFFETPRALRKRRPDLYAELAGFYQLDPAALWEAEDGPRP